MDKRVMSTAEAAEYIGTTEKTLRVSRCPSAKNKFKGPNYRRIGKRKIVYFREELDRWLDGLEEVEA